MGTAAPNLFSHDLKIFGVTAPYFHVLCNFFNNILINNRFGIPLKVVSNYLCS